MQDEQIVALFFSRDEQAIAAVQEKYQGYCRSISERILCSREDVEECLNDVWLKTWNTIPPQRPTLLSGYVGMLARQISLNRSKENRRKKRGGGEVSVLLDELSECIADPTAGTVSEDIAIRDALDRFLASLSERTRVIFIRRYWYVQKREEIARDFGMAVGAVDVLLCRTRKNLKKFLEREGICL